MLIQFEQGSQRFSAHLSEGTDLSIPLKTDGQVNCFYAPPVSYEPVRMGSFVGSTAEGGVVNFFNVQFNPHGNGTHTECVGHIATEPYVLYQCLKESHFLARLISVYPQKMDNGDRVILPERIQEQLMPGEVSALVVRSLPNAEDKRHTQYSGTNPPYFHPDALAYMVACGVQHLLTDLPSVDREEDGGALAAHKAFWCYPGPRVRTQATITELIYVPNDLKDGLYLLDIQTASFELDASPSRPTLYPLTLLDT